MRKKHTSLALFLSIAPLESIFSSKFLLVNRKCTHVKKILPHFCHFIAFTNYTFLANFREQCIGPGCCLLYRDPNTTVLYLLSQCQVHLSISIFTYLRFWNDPDGSMKAEINVFWIFLNGVVTKGPAELNEEKNSKNVDFSLWGNRATTQNTFFDIFKNTKTEK